MATTPRKGNSPSAHANGNNDNDQHDAGASESKSSVASSTQLERPLRLPTDELAVKERVEILTNCAQFGEAPAAALHGCDAVLVLGDARVGKSTFISYLAGCELEPRSPQTLGLPGSRKRVCVKADSVVPETVPIHHGASNATNAEATYPSVVPCAPAVGHARSLAFCEAPTRSHGGRTAELDIATAANLGRALARAASVRVVLLVNFHAVRANRTRCMAQLLAICEGLLGGPSQAGVHARSCLLGVTHMPVGGDEEASVASLREELETPPLPGLLQALAPRLFVYDPLDRDAVQGALDRQGCLRALQELAPLKSEDGRPLQLRAPWRPQDKEHLVALLQTIGDDAVAALEQGGPTEAAETWHCLQRLGVLHLDLVADATRETRSRLVRRLRAAANGVREACALGDFAAARSALELLERAHACGSFQDDVFSDILEEADALGRFLTRMEQRATMAEAKEKEMAWELTDHRRNCDELEERMKAQGDQIRAMAETLAGVERPGWDAVAQHATAPTASPRATSLPPTLNDRRARLQAQKAELEQQLAEVQRQHRQDNEALEEQQAIAAVAAVERREAMERAQQGHAVEADNELWDSQYRGNEAKVRELGAAHPEVDAKLSEDLEAMRTEPERLAAEAERARADQRAEQEDVLAALRGALETINQQLAQGGRQGGHGKPAALRKPDEPVAVRGPIRGSRSRAAWRAREASKYDDIDEALDALRLLTEGPTEAKGVRDASTPTASALIIAAIMQAHPRHAIVQKGACAAIRALASEGPFRDASIVAGAAGHLVSAMRAHGESTDVQRQACGAIANLACGTPRCRKALFAARAPDAVVAAMRSYPENMLLQRLGCLAITNLAQEKEKYRDALVAAGAPNEIVGAMRVHAAHVELQLVACHAISNLTFGSASRKDALVVVGAAEEITAALASHLEHAKLQHAACGAALSLAVDNGAAQDQLMAAGMAERLVAAMRVHPAQAELQRLACAVIWNLAKDNAAHRTTLINAGALDQIDAAVSTHGDTGGVRRAGDFATGMLLGVTDADARRSGAFASEILRSATSWRPSWRLSRG